MAEKTREERALAVWKRTGVEEVDGDRYIRAAGVDAAMRFELGLYLPEEEWQATLARHGGDALAAMEEAFPDPDVVIDDVQF